VFQKRHFFSDNITSTIQATIAMSKNMLIGNYVPCVSIRSQKQCIKKHDDTEKCHLVGLFNLDEGSLS
jgi:hypothetical protein